MEEQRPISPLSPTKKDFGVQVRKRDFLTTSRDTQTELAYGPSFSKPTKNQNTQTSNNSKECDAQTDYKQAVDAVCQTIRDNMDKEIQADFFNAGLITLMDSWDSWTQ